MSGTIVINGVTCHYKGAHHIPTRTIYCYICNLKVWAYNGQNVFFIATKELAFDQTLILHHIGDGHYMANCYDPECIQAAKIELICPKF